MKRKAGIVCVICGVLLIASSAALALYNLSEDNNAASASANAVNQIQRIISESSDGPAKDTPSAFQSD